jgi:acetone carboxylase gamma subunit
LVARRGKREFPQPSQEWIDETANFSEVFREELEAEKIFSKEEEKPVKVGQIKGIRYKLTPYVNIVDTEQGGAAVCSVCGFVYGPTKQNFKYRCRVYERNPEEIHPPERKMAPNKEWCIYREFYCPGCGTQVEVEVCPHGAPIWVSYKDLQLK